MAVKVQPTIAAATVDTEYAANIEDMAPIMVDPTPDRCPTMGIYWGKKKEGVVSTLEHIEFDMLTEMGDSYAGTHNIVYKYKTLDPLTSLFYTPKIWYGSHAIGDTKKAAYAHSKYDMAKGALNSIRNGLTHQFNYNLFSNWGESSTYFKPDPQTTGGYMLDINAIMAAAGARMPPKTAIHAMAGLDDRMYSLPMLARGHVNGHTLANMSSLNAEWAPYVLYADDDGTGVPDGSICTVASSGINVDMVIAINTATASIFGTEVLEDFLEGLSTGVNHEWLLPMPTKLYRVLKNSILGERRQTPADLQKRIDLGLNGDIVWEEYNATFYVEPMMDLFWKNSVFAYDPSCVYPWLHSEFAPLVIPYDKISGTNQEATVTKFWGQLMCVDRTGIGAMHGYKAP